MVAEVVVGIGGRVTADVGVAEQHQVIAGARQGDGAHALRKIGNAFASAGNGLGELEVLIPEPGLSIFFFHLLSSFAALALKHSTALSP